MSGMTERRPSRTRLWAEFILFFCAAPLFVAVALEPRIMFPALLSLTAVGLALLFVTPGFRPRLMAEGLLRMSSTLILFTALGTLVVGYIILSLDRPQALWILLKINPELMAVITLGYPFVSALPQEIVFRVLFFERYAALLPSTLTGQITLNAIIFSWAHIMYWSWIVAALTFVGGLLFAYSYRVRGNFPEAVVAHSVAGVVLFLVGMGVYFYSGNVQRPF